MSGRFYLDQVCLSCGRSETRCTFPIFRLQLGEMGKPKTKEEEPPGELNPIGKPYQMVGGIHRLLNFPRKICILRRVDDPFLKC